MSSPYNYILLPTWRILLRLLLVLGLILLWAGVLRLESVPHQQDNNLIALVDTSRSMSVEDIVSSGGVIHSRLDTAQRFLRSLAHMSPHALMTFSDVARLQLPLSDDPWLWDATVDSLSPSQWSVATDIDGALAKVAMIYGDTPISVIVLTDGESTVPSLSGARLPQTMRIVLVGIGSEDGGKIIDRYDGDGNIVYKTYQGKEVISRLDIAGLSRLQDQYHTELFMIKKTEDIAPIGESIRTFTAPVSRWFSLDPFLIIGALLVFLSLILPDYRLT